MHDKKFVYVLVGIGLLFGISGFQSSDAEVMYACNSNNIDSEWIVYKHTTLEVNNSIVDFIQSNPDFENEMFVEYLIAETDLDLWHSLRNCITSYGINPEIIAKTPQSMKNILAVDESEIPTTFEIPNWIKDSAQLWIDDKSNVYHFSNAINFISKTNAWNDSIIIQYAAGSSPEIPYWTDDVVSWWLQSHISDKEFVDFLEDLSSREIIKR